MENLNNLINKRILARLANEGIVSRYATVEEYKVLEVSPAGNWVKLQNINGNKFWRAVVDVGLVEVLKDLREGCPRE